MDERLRQLFAMGRGHYKAGNYDEAEPALSEVLRQHDGFADIYNMLGVIYHAQARFSEAEQAFEGALRLNPSYTEAALNLSVIYNDQGKYHDARRIYLQVVSNSHAAPGVLDPFARGKIANMHAELGGVYASTRMFAEAVREYETALELCPTFIDIRTKLAHVCREMGHLERAVDHYEQVKRERRDYLPARVALGVTLFSMSRIDEAIEEWEQVLEFDPDNKNARLYLKMLNEDDPPVPAGG